MKSYADAIQILQEVIEGKKEALSLLFIIARQDPDALVRAATHRPAWVYELMEVLEKQNNPIECIKLIRANRGLGLKEAKDIYDELKTMQGVASRSTLIERALA
jgi:ribosomal protein L7/L12